MHPTITQRRAVLDGLRERTTLATSVFYAKIGRDEPVRPFRYIVEPRGNNRFHVTDRHTNQVKGIRTGITAATRFAQDLEDAPVAIQEHSKLISRVKWFAQQMLCWTVSFAVCLGLFIAMGAQP